MRSNVLSCCHTLRHVTCCLQFCYQNACCHICQEGTHNPVLPHRRDRSLRGLPQWLLCCCAIVDAPHRNSNFIATVWGIIFDLQQCHPARQRRRREAPLSSTSVVSPRLPQSPLPPPPPCCEPHNYLWRAHDAVGMGCIDCTLCHMDEVAAAVRAVSPTLF